MRAIQVAGAQDSPQITLASLPDPPPPQDAELLIRVHAAGITGDEVLWPELWNDPLHIPGHDISGTIVALGPSYTGPLRPGDDVYAMLHADRGRGQADFAIASEEEVVRKPARLSHAEAAALPIPVLTAWEGVFQHGKLKPGMRVLVTGASGAVGLVTVQIAAKVAGAEVVALAAGKHHENLKRLGASEVVDYRTPNWEGTLTGPVDVVFDTVGDPVLANSWKTVKPDGLVMTVGNVPPAWEWGKGRPEELDEHPNVKWLYFIVKAHAERLAKIAGLIDDGTIEHLPVVTFPADQGVEAWKVAGQRDRAGKVVMEFVQEYTM